MCGGVEVGTGPRTLKLGTNAGGMSTSCSAALAPTKDLRYPQDRLGAPQSRSGQGGKEKNLCFCRESNPVYPLA